MKGRRKMKKRILSLFLVLALALSLAACGGSSSAPAAPAADAQSSAAAASSAKEEAPAPAAEASSSESEAASAVSEASAASSAPAEEEPAAAEEIAPYEFNISYGGTPSSSMVAVMTALQEILAEESGGAFTFNVYNDNSYKESQALDEMMNDIVDIVYLASGATSGTVTEVAYLGMPGCYRYTDDPEEFKKFEASVADIMSGIYDQYGIHYLGLRVPARMAIVGTGDTVSAPADLEGKVVRVAGTWLGKLAVAMNIATANVGLSELATALQRKTVDSCFTGIEQVYSQMLGEVVDYATILPETDGIGALVMDADCWNKLDDAQKACVERSVEKWMDSCLEVSNEFYATAIQHLEENDVDIRELTDEETDAFLYAVPSVYEEIDAQTSDLGIQLKDAILAYRSAQ